jgi:receptor protein-tyrosine kinase
MNDPQTNVPKKTSHLAERAAERLSTASELAVKMPNRQPENLASPPLPNPVFEPAEQSGVQTAENAAEAGVETQGVPASAGFTKPFPTTMEMPPAAPPLLRPIPPVPPSARANGVIDLATLIGGGLVVGGNTRTRISEEYRIAVSRILRAARPKRVGTAAGELLMVTSARPGEGKSFTALNLAGAIAHNVMRPTVLVDIDFKQKSITYQLGLSDRIGLLDVASSTSLRIEDLIVPTVIEHLSILPVGRDAGVAGGEIADGVVRRPISQVIERLARRFPDHIFVLDLPPCLSTSDPSTLAPVVNEIIMVVEAERTQRNEVEAALDLVKLCPKITLLLNKIQMTSSYTFGAYDYFGSYS